VAVGTPAFLTSGRVRIYEWSGSAWVQLGGDIDGEAAGDNSGDSVSLSADGNRVAIGARFNAGNGGGSGQVRIYEWSGSAWVQLGGDIDGEASGDNSGSSVSLSADGSRVAIGAPRSSENGFDSGQVRIYEWSGSAWTQLGESIDGEEADDNSGVSVSISSDGSRLAIGAPNNDENGENSGHVRIYGLLSGVESALVPQNKHAIIKSKAIEAGEHHIISGGITLPPQSRLLVGSETDSLVASVFGVEIS
jgi:hypothetical protein